MPYRPHLPRRITLPPPAEKPDVDRHVRRVRTEVAIPALGPFNVQITPPNGKRVRVNSLVYTITPGGGLALNPSAIILYTLAPTISYNCITHPVAFPAAAGQVTIHASVDLPHVMFDNLPFRFAQCPLPAEAWFYVPVNVTLIDTYPVGTTFSQIMIDVEYRAI